MSEIERLAAAIQTISETYLGRVVARGDKPAILKWSTRLADYSTRLAVLVSPPLAMSEAVDLDESPMYDHVLTEDEEWAIFLDAEDEMLKALGRPYGRGQGQERGALPLLTHVQMCEDLGLPILAAHFRSYVVPGYAQ